MKRYSIYKKLVLQDERSKKLSFETDNRIHYVYRITYNNEYYYGSRTSLDQDIIKDFWNYGTSSKRKNLIIENKEKYKLKIIKVFDNPGDKILYESYLHQLFDVKNHNSFWNESNQTPFGFDTTGMKFIFTQEHKNNMSKAFKGRKLSLESIEKIKSTRKNNIVDGLNSYQRAGLKCSETKKNYSKERKKDVKNKRLKSLEGRTKEIQSKTMKYRKDNNLNSNIAIKGNETKKRNLEMLLKNYKLTIIFENNNIEVLDMVKCHYGEEYLPYDKINLELKKKYGFTLKKSKDELFNITLTYKTLNNEKALKFNNAQIKKERK